MLERRWGFGESESILTTSVFTSQSKAIIVPPPPFTPLSIPACILWLDGNDVNGNGMNPSSGTNLEIWFDKSGLGNDGFQANGSLQPVFETNVLNSKASVEFTSSSQTMIGTNAATDNPNLSAFLVFQYASTAGGNATMLVGTNPGEFLGFGLNSGSPPYFNAFHLFDYEADYAPADTDFHYLSAIYPNSTNEFQLWIDGNPQTSSQGSPGAASLGNQYSIGLGLIGYICEIVLYDRNVTMVERLELQTYFAQKWGL